MKASLEKRVETVEETDLDVFGIQRVMEPVSCDPVEWHSYYSAEGLLCFTSSLSISCTIILLTL